MIARGSGNARLLRGRFLALRTPSQGLLCFFTCSAHGRLRAFAILICESGSLGFVWCYNNCDLLVLGACHSWFVELRDLMAGEMIGFATYEHSMVYDDLTGLVILPQVPPNNIPAGREQHFLTGFLCGFTIL
jgi:hypothetical protein